jgi:hypothetical protein
MIVYILWFTITLMPGVDGHFPVDQEFPTLTLCMKAAEEHWVPLLTKQFPNDPHLTVACLPWSTPKVKI